MWCWGASRVAPHPTPQKDKRIMDACIETYTMLDDDSVMKMFALNVVEWAGRSKDDRRVFCRWVAGFWYYQDNDALACTFEAMAAAESICTEPAVIMQKEHAAYLVTSGVLVEAVPRMEDYGSEFAKILQGELQKPLLDGLVEWQVRPLAPVK